jgi:hypothetical protein
MRWEDDHEGQYVTVSKEEFMEYLHVLFRNSTSKTKDNNERPHSGQPISRLRVKPVTSILIHKLFFRDFHKLYAIHKSHDSSVGITLGYGLDDRGSRVPFPGIFLFTTASGTALKPTQPPIQWVPAALSLGVKRPGCEADHLPPSSAEAKE